MATSYSAILNSEVDPDSPLTTSLMTRLRDNPIAIAEGASGAPRVAIELTPAAGSPQTAIATDETTTTKVLSPDGTGSVEWADFAGLGFRAVGSDSVSVNASAVTIVLPTEDYDEGSDLASGVYTAPQAGLYDLFTGGYFQAPNDGSSALRVASLDIYVNGSLEQRISGPLTGNSGTKEKIAASYPLKLAAADTVSIKVTPVSGSGTANFIYGSDPVANGYNQAWFGIHLNSRV